MRSKSRGWGYLYLLPTALLLAIFVLYPMAYTVYLSFFDWNLIAPTKNFVGLANYLAVVTDPVNRQVLMNTVAYLLILVVVNFIVPYLIALVVKFFIHQMQTAYKIVFFIPSLFSLVVGAMLFSWILNPIAGPLAQLMRGLGLQLPHWTTSGALAILVLSLITNWKVFGYNFVLLLTGLGSVPPNIIDAAKMDAIPRWRLIKDVVLPYNKSIALYVLILTVVQGLQYVFTPINVITQGGPDYGSSNILYHSYLNAFVLYKTGNAAALAVVTLVIFMSLLYLEMRLVERKGGRE